MLWSAWGGYKAKRLKIVLIKVKVITCIICHYYGFALRPRGHNYDVPRVIYEATKRSFMITCMDKRQYVVVLLFSPR